jgi:hypothetical protein
LPSASTTITACPSGDTATARCGNADRGLDFGLREAHAGEGAGQQLAPRVGKLGAQQHRARAGIHGEIGEAQRSLFGIERTVLEQQADLSRLAAFCLPALTACCRRSMSE